MGWEAQCGEDLRHLLHTLQRLPMDPDQATSNVGPLVTLCNTRFAALPSQPNPATSSSTGEDHARRLHRSLTESDARPQKKHGHLFQVRAEQQLEAESDRTAAGRHAQGTLAVPPEIHVGDGAEDLKLLQDGQHTAATHGVSQQPSEADSVLSTSHEALLPSSSSQSATAQGPTECWNGTSVPEGQSSAWNGAVASVVQPGQAGQEAQQADAAKEEAADQEVGMTDGGEVDMVATSSAVLAAPTLLSESTKSDTKSEGGSNETVSLTMQLDGMG